MVVICCDTLQVNEVLDESICSMNLQKFVPKQFIQADFDDIINKRNEYQKHSEICFQSYMEAKDIKVKT
jgi:hypothetical protein